MSNDSRKRCHLLLACSAFGLTLPATGQNNWLIDISYSDPAGIIDSVDDTATITLISAWDPAQYAFRKAYVDLTADDPVDAGLWSDPKRLLTGPGSVDGTVEGESVTGIIPSQLHTDNNIFADTSNPIAVWTATWQTSDLRIRSIPLVTVTADFWLYVDEIGTSESFLDTLNEGTASITVVPSPGVLCLLLVSAAVQIRTKRPSTAIGS